MDRKAIVQEVKEYFDIDEFACTHLLEYYKNNTERIWDFLDTGLLANLLVIRRDMVQRPMYCNNHKRGQHQRGIRCNLCELVKEKNRPYLSGHVLGKAADFSIDGISGVREMDRIRQRIVLLQGVLPVPMRMEAGVSWLHIDVMPTPNGQKVYEFKQ